jgi:hypothetical protein
LASHLTWRESLFDRALADGRNRAALAIIDVNRKDDWVRTKCAVWTRGSKPHLVCARCW